MTDALLSEFLIALFAGLVAVVIMRRNTPRAVELVLWIGLVWVCVLGVTGIRDRAARDLAGATFYGVIGILGSVIGVGFQSLVQWMIANRFVIADWAVLAAGVDLLALALVTSRRQGDGWQPQVRLRDWMELPRLAQPRPVPVTVSAPEQINERFNVWAPVAAAAALTWTTLMLIWTGDVAVPAVRRRARGVAVRAEGARRRVVGADWRQVVASAGAEPRKFTEQVVDFSDLSRRAAEMRSRAASWLTEAGTTPESHWLGGFGVMPPNALDGEMQDDGTQRDRRDQLAS